MSTATIDSDLFSEAWQAFVKQASYRERNSTIHIRNCDGCHFDHPTWDEAKQMILDWYEQERS